MTGRHVTRKRAIIAGITTALIAGISALGITIAAYATSQPTAELGWRFEPENGNPTGLMYYFGPDSSA